MKKRGMSPVIASVLLIIITLVVFIVLNAFVIPFTSKSLDASCNDAINQINFELTEYSCYVEQNGEEATGFSVKIFGDDVAGFRIGFLKSGELITRDVINGESFADIRMLNGDFGSALNVPSNGATRTYVANGIFERVDISPILENGKACGVVKSSNTRICTDPNIRNTLIEPEPAICGDFVCNSNLGETCLTCEDDCGPCPAECDLTSATWSVTETEEGNLVNLQVAGNSCQNEIIEFEILEDDDIDDDNVVNDPQNVNFGQNGAWNAEWQNDNGDGLNCVFANCAPPEYYFIARVVGEAEEIVSSQLLVNELKVYKCGDGIISPEYGEQCDDNNNNNGDGCSSICVEESGWSCTGVPSSCSQIPQTHLECISNTCTSVNGAGGNTGGCNSVGQVCTSAQCGDGICLAGEMGVCCSDCPVSGPPNCEPATIQGCGNGILEFPEECDDGNLEPDDGCDETCHTEGGFSCWHSPGNLSLCCPTSGSSTNPLCGSGGIGGNPGTIGNDPNGWNPWTGWNPGGQCSIGSQSCQAVFNGQFGWQFGSVQSDCTCGGFNECNQVIISAYCAMNPGSPAPPGFDVCCKEGGAISVTLVSCGSCNDI